MIRIEKASIITEHDEGQFETTVEFSENAVLIDCSEDGISGASFNISEWADIKAFIDAQIASRECQDG